MKVLLKRIGFVVLGLISILCGFAGYMSLIDGLYTIYGFAGPALLSSFIFLLFMAFCLWKISSHPEVTQKPRPEPKPQPQG